MSGELLKAAQAEAANLERQLQADPVYQKLAVVRSVIEMYAGRTQATPVAASSAREIDGAKGRVTSRAGSQANSVVSAAEAFLRTKNERAQTTEILEHLKEVGVVFNSAKPVGSLSSALSHHSAFDNRRGLGYGLSEWGGADRGPMPSSPPKDASGQGQGINHASAGSGLFGPAVGDVDNAEGDTPE